MEHCDKFAKKITKVKKKERLWKAKLMLAVQQDVINIGELNR